MSFSVDLSDSVAVNRQLCSDLYNFFVVSCFFFQASMFLREWLQLPYNYSTIFGVLDSLPDPPLWRSSSEKLFRSKIPLAKSILNAHSDLRYLFYVTENGFGGIVCYFFHPNWPV